MLKKIRMDPKDHYLHVSCFPSAHTTCTSRWAHQISGTKLVISRCEKYANDHPKTRWVRWSIQDHSLELESYPEFYFEFLWRKKAHDMESKLFISFCHFWFPFRDTHRTSVFFIGINIKEKNCQWVERFLSLRPTLSFKAPFCCHFFSEAILDFRASTGAL